MKIIDQSNLDKNNITIPEFGIENNIFEIELSPRVYELVDINNAIKQRLSGSDFELNIKADTISMKSVLTTFNNKPFISIRNTLLGFTNTDYSEGTHKSDNPLLIKTTEKVHLKYDCIDGSIVNGIREQTLFSFNLSAPPGNF